MEKSINLENDFLNFFCEKCNNKLKDDWDYCPYCITKIKMEKCLNCDKEIKKGWDYCPFCKEARPKKKVGKDISTNKESNDWLRDILVKS